MPVDLPTVRRIATLARITLPEGEADHLRGELNAILDFVATLGEVDVDGVEPMTSVIPMALRLRPDVVTDGGIAAAVLANAPAREDDYYVVPKVIE